MPVYPIPYQSLQTTTQVVRSITDDAEFGNRAALMRCCDGTGRLPYLSGSDDNFLPASSRISNRARRGKLSVIFINGMNTTLIEANAACRLACDTLGLSRDDVRLIYNPSERCRAAGLVKVSGGMISHRIGNAIESNAVSALRREMSHIIDSPDERLLIIGHSQGSVIFQNASDDLYDECMKSEVGQRRWNSASARIEGLLYAPIIAHTVPGLEVVGFTFDTDVAARTGACFSRFVTSGKNLYGWRPYSRLDVVELPYFADSSAVNGGDAGSHNILTLLLNDARFTVANFGTAPSGEFSAELLAARLAHSIRHGLRSDDHHLKSIALAADTYGVAFVRPFLMRVTKRDGQGWIYDFCIAASDFRELERTASLTMPGDDSGMTAAVDASNDHLRNSPRSDK